MDFLYQIFQRKIQAAELALSVKLEQQLSNSYSPRLFYVGLVLLNVELVAWQISADFYKFFVIIFADPGNSFNLFFRQRELRSCPFSYDSYKKVQAKVRIFSAAGVAAIVIVSVASSLATNLLFGGKQPSWAATYGWAQDSWTAVSGSYPYHDADAGPYAGWSYYDSASNIATGTSLTLALSTISTSTSAATGGFNLSGITTSSTVAGNSVTLAQQVLDVSALTTDDSANKAIANPSQQGGWAYGTFATTTPNGSSSAAASVQLTAANGGTGAEGSVNLANSPGVSCAIGNPASISGTYPNCVITSGTRNFTTFTVGTGVTLVASGTGGLIIKATGAVTINGTLNLSGGNGTISSGGARGSGGGAGGFSGAGGNGSASDTLGGAGASGNMNGGAGGNYGGGGGSSISGNTGRAGGSYSGGGGGTISGGGGGGGGIVDITSAAQITVTGGVVANGGNGYPNAGGGSNGGGGGGGRITLTAPNVSNSGVISANGGNGGTAYSGLYYAGGGGGGVIKIYSGSGAINGTLPVVAGGTGYQTGGVGAIVYSTVPYNSPGTYISYIDGGIGVSWSWNNFSWTQTSPTSTATISYKVIATNSTSTPTTAQFNASACTVAATTANGLLTLSGGACSTSLGTANRYLWYQATLNASADFLKTPTLDSVSANLYLTNYKSSGVYTSPVVDTGAAVADWGGLSFINSGGQVMAIKVRSGNAPDLSDSVAFASIAASTTASGVPLSSLGVATGKRFVQYQAVLSTSDVGLTPSLDSVTFNGYSQYATSAYLVSSPYNSRNAYNLISRLIWSASSTVGTSIQLQVRTAPDSGGAPGAWSGWCGYDDAGGTCGGGNYFLSADNNQILPANMPLNSGDNDQWFQYKVILASDGANTPSFEGITVNYVTNAPPSAQITNSPFQSATGTIAVVYQVQDIDSDSDTAIGPGKLIASLQFCTDATLATCPEKAPGSGWVTATQASVIGDIGTTTASTTLITGKQLVWTPKDDPQVPASFVRASSSFKLRLKVDDGETANNLAYATSTNFLIDIQPPTLGTQHLTVISASQSVFYPNATDFSAMQFRVATVPTAYSSFSEADTGGWQAYTATTSITVSNNPTTIYIQYRDAYDNFSPVVSVTTPDTPQSFMIQDTSNLKDGLHDYRLFIAWKKVTDNQPSAPFAAYDVYRSVNNGASFDLYTTIASSTINFFADNAASSDIATYYYVTTRDTDGNTSFRSPVVKAQADGIQNFGEGGGGMVAGGSDMPPTIDESTIATSSVYTTQATVSWDTNLPSDSLVYYQTAPGCDFTAAISAGSATMRSEPSTLGSHTVTLTGLTPATAYYFQVRSTGPSGLVASSTCAGDGYSFTTQAGPAIVPGSVTRTNIGNTTIDISWTTDQAADSYVVFSTSSSLTNSIELGSSNEVTDHRVTLFGLTPNTNYYCYVKSANARDDNGGEYYAFTTTQDLTPPTVSAANAAATDNAAVITFATAKPATSTVTVTNHDVPTETYTTSLDTLNTAHRFDFAGLAANTLYDVAIAVRDANGNTDTDATSFTTLAAPDTQAPAISNLDVTTSPTGAVITWDTATENATGYVEYATTSATSTFELTYRQVGRSTFDPTHTVALEGLVTNQTYYFRLRSADASGNTATDPSDGTFHSFQTVLQPLSLTNVATSTITSDSAVITWSTNHQADSRVSYGTTTGSYPLTQTNPASTTEHAIILTNLASSTTYYFRARSTDTLGQTATSSEFSFTTAAAPIDPNDYQSSLDQVNDLLTQIAALQAAASSTDSTDAATIASLQSQVASLQQQLAAANNKGGGGTLIIDKTDKVAPKISEIRTNDLTSGSVRISWTTDEPASSFVSYGIGSTSGSFGDWQAVTAHTAALKELVPGTAYAYRVASTDASGNLTISPDQTFVTPTLEAQLKSEGKTEEEIAKLVEAAEQPDENQTNILLAAAQKAMEIMSQVANQVSLGTLETTLLSQFDTIERLAGSIPGPILGGEPMVVTGASTATVSWSTDKEANSLVAYAPEGVYIKAEGDDGYLQVVGNANSLITKHEVRLAGLKPSTVYHYQLRSKAQLGPEAKSRDFTFKTKEEGLEVLTHGAEIKDPSTAIFRWSTNLEADTKVIVTPYRSGKLAVEEKKESENKILTTMHESEIRDLEAGIVYMIAMQSRDQKGRIAEEVLEQFSTSKDDLPPQVTNVQTESALSQGKQLKVQTIVSWQTNEPTVGQVQYIKGVVTDDREFPDKTALETTYSRKHVAVVTKFDSGQVYTFRITATDSSGNTVTSKIYTILTPKQKESVFQLILKNFEDIFGWVGKVGN